MDMSDLPQNDDIVTIDGKQYSRLMAGEMARDIELAHSIRPGVWAVGDNSSLIIGNIAMLSFREPIQHGYLVDSQDAPPEVQGLLDANGSNPGFKHFPTYRYLKLPKDGLRHSLELLRSAHESVVRQLAADFFTRCQRWKWHNFDVATLLGEIVGHVIPDPGYADELHELNANRAQDSEDGDFSIEHVEGRRYWKVSAGVQDKYWNDMLRLGRVHHENWAADPVHLNRLPTNHEAFVHAITQHGGIAKPAADHCWRFMHEMKPGDLVAAVEGDRSLGWAEITGDYEYVDDNGLPQHQRTVDWTELAPYQISNMSQGLKADMWGIGSRELAPPHFAEAIGAQMVGYESESVKVAGAPQIFAMVRPEVLERLARDIRIAHEINGNSWALMQIQETGASPGIVMFVGQLNTSWIRADGGGWLFYGSPDEPQFEHLDRTSMKTDYEPSIFWIRSSTQDGLATLAGSNPDSHDRAIKYLASNVRTRTGRANQHEARTLEALEAAMGEDLPRPDYGPTAPGPTEPIDPLSTVRDQFAATGLYYTDAQIATFYTSLQTKGFVVLSGISGTGKSKIATGFVEMLPGHNIAIGGSSSPTGAATLSFKLSPTETWVAIPASQSDLFPPIDENDRQSVTIDFDGQSYKGSIILRTLAQGKPTLYLSLETSLSITLRNLGLDRRFFPTFELDGAARTVTRVTITDQPEASEGAPTGGNTDDTRTNHIFLSVRPDWRDSTSLLGYYNPLTQTYEWTEFLHFIIRARDNFLSDKPIAWFVILDEMNLAHVEYYFADLLSVLESGRDKQGLTKESLHFTYPDTLDDKVPLRSINLPPNLYIIGTVNMDETTHAFSSKVLDRAFTIELTDVDFVNYQIAGAGFAKPALTDGEKDSLFAAFTRQGKFARIDKDEIAEVVKRYPRIRAHLATLNALLQPHRMHFGYRIFDEVCQYLYNNDLNKMMTFEAAFDEAVFMKVLPKFSGSRARLQSPLHGVLAWAVDPHHTTREAVEEVVKLFNAYVIGAANQTEAWTAEPAFPAVARRVRDMLVALERDGFVSFG
jgi:hypothetical protein